MRTISKLIVHHAFTPTSMDVGVEEVRKWHVDGNGWNDVGYHYIIRLDGTLEPGRPVEKKGAHCKGHNSQSIGICYMGGKLADGTAGDTRTDEQKKALKNLLKALQNIYPTATIHGHNEFSTKACPGFDVKKEYQNI